MIKIYNLNENKKHQLNKGILCMIDILDLNEEDTLIVIYEESFAYIVDIFKNNLSKQNIYITHILIENTDAETLNAIYDKHTTAKNLILLTKNSLTHHKHTKKAVLNGAKVLSCVNISKNIILRAADFDYVLIEKITDIMSIRLENANKIKIINDGLSFSFKKEKRKLKVDKTKLTPFGQCNFPIGEVCVAPIEHSGNGMVKFDRIMVPYEENILYLNNVIFEIKNGKIVDSKTDSAKKVFEHLSNFENGNILGEFGIGTNPWTLFNSSITESEKCLGTVHLAFGANKSLFGENESLIHKDGIMQKPTVFFDNEKIIDKGNILIEEIKEIVENLDF
ncbi:hypothetical protein GQ473_01630 [archaeon]|nr:hypothetical protein [archaeon]